MPRLRRKTPHEPVTAIPAPSDRLRARTPRSLAALLNEGRPPVETRLPPPPAPDVAATPAAAARPFRERVASREGVAELLVFRLGPELFATELRAVEEAVEGALVQSIPDSPTAMIGLFALRERTLPVYSLATVLGLPAAEVPQVTLVVRPSAARIAVMVDAVDDVHQTALDAVRPAPPGDDGDAAVLGVVWRGSELVTLLDCEAVVAACLAQSAPESR